MNPLIPSAQQTPPSPIGQAPAGQLPNNALPLATTPANNPAPAASTQPANVQNQFKDKDIIDKSWIEKAKQIIASTADDPYKLSQDISVFKAEFMKQQFNKDIKLGE